MNGLVVRDLWVRRRSVSVLREVSLSAEPGAIVGVVGSNGAGKSTLLSTVAGLVPAQRGEVLLDGTSVLGRSPQRLVRHGLALVPQGHRVFGGLSVRRNLEVGGATVADARRVDDRVDALLDRYPLLQRRRDIAAGALSGGEQTVLVLCRALVAEPRVLLLDEPLLGVARELSSAVLDHLRELAAAGTAVVLVEHDRAALASVATSVLELVDGAVRA